MHRLLSLSILLLAQLCLAADHPTCPMVKMRVERLPDLTIPRSGHSVFCTPEGEVTVVGGHTTGFIPTPTAEYFADGAWHLMQMTYTHDYGITVMLDSSRVLLAGGCEKNLGIGQTLEAEFYDYRTHTFTGFGCLDQRRALATGTRMADGSVVIAGNWFSKTDSGSIERFDGRSQFSFVKPTAQPTRRPYILPISDDDALIFGTMDDKGRLLDTIMVDRLKGEPFRVPILEQYRPPYFETEPNNSDCIISDGRLGEALSICWRVSTERDRWSSS